MGTLANSQVNNYISQHYNPSVRPRINTEGIYSCQTCGELITFRREAMGLSGKQIPLNPVRVYPQINRFKS
jgi:hypothetical protein